MNILVVNYYDINKLPPVRNLVQNLLANGHNVTIITFGTSDLTSNLDKGKLKYIELKESKNNILSKTLNFFFRKISLRKLIKNEMKYNNLIWTTTDRTVREIGSILFNYKHIMQLMELCYDMPAFPFQNKIKFNLKKYGQAAFKVVVPEYNRAHILKTWWELKKTPCIFPNKPYRIEIDNVPIDVLEKLEIVKKEKRKVILYQGVFGKDRRLDEFASAISKVGNEYCLYIMGPDDASRKELCDKFQDIIYIPFIKPPFHLLVTRYAHIGLLPYIPSKNQGHNSELNALYCAPNKIYEYSAFGLPMIGTDVPGLAYPFNMYGIGVCCEKLSVDSIISAINTIESNYEQMKENCYKFYNDTNLDAIVKNIIECDD